MAQNEEIVENVTSLGGLGLILGECHHGKFLGLFHKKKTHGNKKLATRDYRQRAPPPGKKMIAPLRRGLHDCLISSCNTS